MAGHAIASELTRIVGVYVGVYIFLWLVFTGWIKNAYGVQWRFVSYAGAIVATGVQAVLLFHVLDRLAELGVKQVGSLGPGQLAAVVAVCWLIPGAWVWFDAMKRLNPAFGFPIGVIFGLTGLPGAVAWYFFRNWLSQRVAPATA